MNKKNSAIILERIREEGGNLEGKLPASSKHPQGRNPYAHISSMIKRLLGGSYTDLPDEELPRVLEIIDICENNPF